MTVKLYLFAKDGYDAAFGYEQVAKRIANIRLTATVFNKIQQKMLRKVGRKTTFFMLKYVKNNCKGGKCMDNTRRIYLDNIRWITVCIVVIYHVIYMYNGVQPFGAIGPFKEQQPQDAFQ